MSKYKYNHAYAIAFEVLSDREDAKDVTPGMIAAALRQRIDRLLADGEMLEAVGCPYDTFDFTFEDEPDNGKD